MGTARRGALGALALIVLAGGASGALVDARRGAQAALEGRISPNDPQPSSEALRDGDQGSGTGGADLPYLGPTAGWAVRDESHRRGYDLVIGSAAERASQQSVPGSVAEMEQTLASLAAGVGQEAARGERDHDAAVAALSDRAQDLATRSAALESRETSLAHRAGDLKEERELVLGAMNRTRASLAAARSEMSRVRQEQRELNRTLHAALEEAENSRRAHVRAALAVASVRRDLLGEKKIREWGNLTRSEAMLPIDVAAVPPAEHENENEAENEDQDENEDEEEAPPSRQAGRGAGRPAVAARRSASRPRAAPSSAGSGALGQTEARRGVGEDEGKGQGGGDEEDCPSCKAHVKEARDELAIPSPLQDGSGSVAEARAPPLPARTGTEVDCPECDRLRKKLAELGAASPSGASEPSLLETGTPEARPDDPASREGVAVEGANAVPGESRLVPTVHALRGGASLAEVTVALLERTALGHETHVNQEVTATLGRMLEDAEGMQSADASSPEQRKQLRQRLVRELLRLLQALEDTLVDAAKREVRGARALRRQRLEEFASLRARLATLRETVARALVGGDILQAQTDMLESEAAAVSSEQQRVHGEQRSVTEESGALQALRSWEQQAFQQAAKSRRGTRNTLNRTEAAVGEHLVTLRWYDPKRNGRGSGSGSGSGSSGRSREEEEEEAKRRAREERAEEARKRRKRAQERREEQQGKVREREEKSKEEARKRQERARERTKEQHEKRQEEEEEQKEKAKKRREKAKEKREEEESKREAREKRRKEREEGRKQKAKEHREEHREEQQKKLKAREEKSKERAKEHREEQQNKLKAREEKSKERAKEHREEQQNKLKAREEKSKERAKEHREEQKSKLKAREENRKHEARNNGNHRHHHHHHHHRTSEERAKQVARWRRRWRQWRKRMNQWRKRHAAAGGGSHTQHRHGHGHGQKRGRDHGGRGRNHRRTSEERAKQVARWRRRWRQWRKRMRQRGWRRARGGGQGGTRRWSMWTKVGAEKRRSRSSRRVSARVLERPRVGKRQSLGASPRISGQKATGARQRTSSRRVEGATPAAKKTKAPLREASRGEATEGAKDVGGATSACWRKCARDGEQDPHCYHRCLEDGKRAAEPSKWGSTRRFLDDMAPPPRSGAHRGVSRPSQRDDPVASRLYTPATATQSETNARASAKEGEASPTSRRSTSPGVAGGEQDDT